MCVWKRACVHRLCVHVCKGMCVHPCVQVYKGVCTCVCVGLCTCVSRGTHGCVHVYVETCMCTWGMCRRVTCVCTCAWECMCTGVCRGTWVCARVCVQMCARVCIGACVACTGAHMGVCMYVCMHVCVQGVPDFQNALRCKLHKAHTHKAMVTLFPIFSSTVPSPMLHSGYEITGKVQFAGAPKCGEPRLPCQSSKINTFLTEFNNMVL